MREDTAPVEHNRLLFWLHVVVLHVVVQVMVVMMVQVLDWLWQSRWFLERLRLIDQSVRSSRRVVAIMWWL